MTNLNDTEKQNQLIRLSSHSQSNSKSSSTTDHMADHNYNNKNKVIAENDPAAEFYNIGTYSSMEVDEEPAIVHESMDHDVVVHKQNKPLLSNSAHFVKISENDKPEDILSASKSAHSESIVNEVEVEELSSILDEVEVKEVLSARNMSPENLDEIMQDLDDLHNKKPDLAR